MYLQYIKKIYLSEFYNKLKSYKTTILYIKPFHNFIPTYLFYY